MVKQVDKVETVPASITFSVNPALLERAKKAAVKDVRTLASFCRLALEDYVGRSEGKR